MTKNFFKMLACELLILISYEKNPIDNQSELDDEQQVYGADIIKI